MLEGNGACLMHPIDKNEVYEEGARAERQCARAARNPMLSAHLRIADDVYYKDHSSLPTSDLSGSCARACSAERPRGEARGVCEGAVRAPALAPDPDVPLG